MILGRERNKKLKEIELKFFKIYLFISNVFKKEKNQIILIF
jgi:hypothetical protein